MENTYKKMNNIFLDNFKKLYKIIQIFIFYFVKLYLLKL